MGTLEGLDYNTVDAFKPQILLTFFNQVKTSCYIEGSL